MTDYFLSLYIMDTRVFALYCLFYGVLLFVSSQLLHTYNFSVNFSIRSLPSLFKSAEYNNRLIETFPSVTLFVMIQCRMLNLLSNFPSISMKRMTFTYSRNSCRNYFIYSVDINCRRNIHSFE